MRNSPTYNFVLLVGWSALFLWMVYVFLVTNQFGILDWIIAVFSGFASLLFLRQYLRARRHQKRRKEQIKAEKERNW